MHEDEKDPDEQYPDPETVRAEAAAQAEAARAEAEARAADVVRAEAENANDPEVQKEWIRQSNLIYGGLMAAGLVIVQPFIAGSTLDTSAKVCVFSFAAAFPLLAGLVLLNSQEAFRQRIAQSMAAKVARAMAQGFAIVGVIAAFWHISWIAGVVILVSGVVAMGVHSAGYTRLEYDPELRRRTNGEPTPGS